MTTRVTIERQDPAFPDDPEKTIEVEVDRTVSVKVGDKVLVEDWEWDSLTFPEAVAIEAMFNGTMREFRFAVSNGSMTAMQILVWVIKKRASPAIRLHQIDMAIGAVTTDTVDVDVPGQVPDDDDDIPPTSGEPIATVKVETPSSESAAATSPTSPTSST